MRSGGDGRRPGRRYNEFLVGIAEFIIEMCVSRETVNKYIWAAKAANENTQILRMKSF